MNSKCLLDQCAWSVTRLGDEVPHEKVEALYHTFVGESRRNYVMIGVEWSKIPDMSYKVSVLVLSKCAHKL